MVARSARNAALPTSSSGVAKRALRRRLDHGSSAASTRWPSLWPSGMRRTPAEIKIGGDRMQEGVQRGRKRDAVAGAGDADRDRIGHWPVQAAPAGRARTRPGRAVASMKAAPCAVVSR